MPTNMTNMTIIMSPKYSCLRIWNVDDAKFIVIDRICTCSKLIFQSESNKDHTKTRNKKHTAQRREIKTNKRKQKLCEITYSIMIEGKTIRVGDFWVKNDAKSPLWKEKKKEVTARVWEGEKERRERKKMCGVYLREFMFNFCIAWIIYKHTFKCVIFNEFFKKNV